MNKTLAIIALTIVLAVPAFAELQNVTVGGSIHIRGNYWTSPDAPDSVTGRNPLFQPPGTNSFAGVPGGNPLQGVRWLPAPGRGLVWSPIDWNKEGSDLRFVEQRTRLNVRADLTNDVSAFIEFDSYDVWGDDFRSNYITGVDFRGIPEVALYQSYIEAKNMFGAEGLSLRIGRQELIFGSGWLVGNNDVGAYFRGLSFDAVRATYKVACFGVDAFAAKLAERHPIEQDGDTDFYGIYGSYTGIEGITLDAYWFLLRDAQAIKDTNLAFIGEAVEDFFNVDDYNVTNLNTIGLRGAGGLFGFHFEAEAAYQFGNAGQVGRSFAGLGLLSPYGDDDASYGKFGGNLQIAYGFKDVKYCPSVFVGGAYFGGEDKRGLSFTDWLGATQCPFWSKDASVSFNRLFTNWQYGDFVSAPFHEATNLWVVYGGVTANPTENLKLIASAAYVHTVSQFEHPWPVFDVFGLRLTPLAYFSFLDEKTPADLAVEVAFKAVYNYSQDLTFETGYSHIFIGDGAAEGNFNIGYGLLNEGGTSDDDADYLYFDTKIKF